MIQNPRGRRHQPLDGPWRILIDPYESGYYDYRGNIHPAGYYLDSKGQVGELVEYDFDQSPELIVPGDWNTQREDLMHYEGCVWYRRRFDAAGSLQASARQILRFEAVSYECVVWLNGEELGSHEGGFSPFEFEVTGRLKAEGNSLVLKVDNRRKGAGVPTLQTDWYNYGGIIRSVMLIELDEHFIEDYEVRLSKEGGIEGWVLVDGQGGSVIVSMPELNIELNCQVGLDRKAKFKSVIRPFLWSPEFPKAYDLILSHGDSLISDRIAFRKIEVRGQDILLNGEPVFLRGISIHEERLGPEGGRLRSAADGAQLLALAKELGCNFVRLAHYPHDEATVREAERLGLMVWEEIPVYWTIQWDNPATEALAQEQLRTMISRDRNRGCVILWSVGNETPQGASRLRFMSGLAQAAKALDPTRLVTAALEQHGGDSREVNDPLGAHLDVLGLNEYIGWYDGPPEKCRKISYAFQWDKPLIISEFGADAKAGLHGPKSERWTEDYQHWVYVEQLAMFSRIPSLRGISPWILKDFRSPRRLLPGIQDGWNRKGLVSERGVKKQAWQVLLDWYRKLSAAAT